MIPPVVDMIYALTDENPALSFWLLYLVVILLSAVVYKLGFAKKLPILKSVVVYIFLVIGCFIITIFAIRFPVSESLIAATVVLSIYKIRLHRSKKNGQVEG